MVYFMGENGFIMLRFALLLAAAWASQRLRVGDVTVEHDSADGIVVFTQASVPDGGRRVHVVTASGGLQRRSCLTLHRPVSTLYVDGSLQSVQII